MIRLQYIGKVYGIEHLNIDPRMWNILRCDDHKELERSTRMLDGLKELGIVSERKAA